MPRNEARYDEVLGKDEEDLSKLARKIIKEEYDKNLNLSVMAERLEVNNGYLGKLFYKKLA